MGYTIIYIKCLHNGAVLFMRRHHIWKGTDAHCTLSWLPISTTYATDIILINEITAKSNDCILARMNSVSHHISNNYSCIPVLICFCHISIIRDLYHQVLQTCKKCNTKVNFANKVISHFYVLVNKFINSEVSLQLKSSLTQNDII